MRCKPNLICKINSSTAYNWLASLHLSPSRSPPLPSNGIFFFFIIINIVIIIINIIITCYKKSDSISNWQELYFLHRGSREISAHIQTSSHTSTPTVCWQMCLCSVMVPLFVFRSNLSITIAVNCKILYAVFFSHSLSSSVCSLFATSLLHSFHVRAASWWRYC